MVALLRGVSRRPRHLQPRAVAPRRRSRRSPRTAPTIATWRSASSRPTTLDAGRARASSSRTAFTRPYERMIRPYPRYAELHARRARRAEPFPSDDLRDLQVWHKLAWMDPDWLAQRPAAARAGRRRAATSPRTTRRRCATSSSSCCARVIPAYRGARRARPGGAVDLAVLSPDPAAAVRHRRASPRAPAVAAAARGCSARPEDAPRAARRARSRSTRRLFGRRPRGVWPSEGSVSDAGGAAARRGRAARGRRPTRTFWRGRCEPDRRRPDAAVSSVSKSARGRAGALLFRDHELSDLIGFAYQSWDAAARGRRLRRRVREAGRRFAAADRRGSRDRHGHSRRRERVGALRRAAAARSCARCTARLERAPRTSRRSRWPRRRPGRPRRLTVDLSRLVDQRRLLHLGGPSRRPSRLGAAGGGARAPSTSARRPVPPRPATARCEELLIAEGSDWFWWYGDDHSSDHDREFDDLFRRHLRNVYAALGEPAPDELFAQQHHDRLGPRSARAIRLADRDRGRPGHAYLEWAGPCRRRWPLAARCTRSAAASLDCRGPGRPCRTARCASGSRGRVSYSRSGRCDPGADRGGSEVRVDPDRAFLDRGRDHY